MCGSSASILHGELHALNLAISIRSKCCIDPVRVDPAEVNLEQRMGTRSRTHSRKFKAFARQDAGFTRHRRWRAM